MEKIMLEKIIAIEEKTNLSLDLLELVKSYCEQNYDKCAEFATMLSVIDLALKNQRDINSMLGNFV